LEQSEESRKISEDKFQKVFSSSPVAFSITTVTEGRFLDVNTAFEKRYGYSRADLIGHTMHELQIWENPEDRTLMIGRLQKGAQIRNIIAPLRTKSGEIKITTVCADRIQFDGQACVLAMSEDLPQYKQPMTN
jgi:PAS domain S-box-containing protein